MTFSEYFEVFFNCCMVDFVIYSSDLLSTLLTGGKSCSNYEVIILKTFSMRIACGELRRRLEAVGRGFSRHQGSTCSMWYMRCIVAQRC